jgi:phenylpyruvate tautomerase PptA (4-oxalocrotonate tautomerase family)
MPVMDLTYPEGTFNDQQRETLTSELTTVLLRAERAPDTQFFADVTWVFLHELAAGRIVAGRKAVEQPIFKLEVTTPQGALSDRRRKELVSEATKTILDAAGLDESKALSVFVLCREIDEGSWGTGGQVIEFAKLREAAAAEREKAEATT